jgi:hypothetical protein
MEASLPDPVVHVRGVSLGCLLVSRLEPGIYRFRFECEHGEYRFVDSPQGFSGDGSFEGFEAEGVFAERE